MRRPFQLRHALPGLLLAVAIDPLLAQTFPFTSGPIPLCDTSVYTANVTGVGTIFPPGTPWSTYLSGVTINITSDHPQTLSISLTSPAGTTLLLSAFNGAGGQNYTSTNFPYWGWTPITSGSAPFTGDWAPQGGNLSVFDYENANGTWTITVVDTSCANGGSGPGGTWTPGWFDGSAAGGAFAFGFSGPPPCPGWIPVGASSICPGSTVDILGFYTSSNPWLNYNITLFGTPVADPSAVNTPGSYSVEAFDPSDGCVYWATYDVVVDAQAVLGPDQVVDVCDDALPVDLTALFNLTGAMLSWTLNGGPIPSALASSATSPGVYELVVSTNAGCNDTAQVLLNVSIGPDLGADGSVNLCAGGSVDLTTLYNVAGASAVWSLGGANYPDPTAASDAGVYTLSATTPDGCFDSADVTVTILAQPSLGSDQAHSICDNTSLDLSLLYNTTGFDAEWTYLGAPVSDPTAATIGGPYRLVASLDPMCADTAFVDLSVYASPDLGPNTFATVCQGESEDITGMFTTLGLSTAWTLGGLPVPDPTVLTEAGSYSLVATNTDGCSDTAQVELDVVLPPTIGPDQSLTVCEGSLVDLNDLFPTGANTVSWTLNGAVVAEPGAVGVAGDYLITLANSSGCSSTATFSLSFAPSPALTDDQQMSMCEGNSVDLSTLYTTSGLTAAWAVNGTTITDVSAIVSGGNYRLVVTNTAGCSDTAWVEVNVNAPPSLGDDRTFTICQWQTVDLTSAFATNGGNGTYLLNDLPVADPGAVAEAGTYHITFTDAAGCTDEALATVIGVECLCEADFIHDAQCLQDPVQFTLLADSTILGAHWEFGGAGAASNEQDPLVNFITGGSINVVLEATLTCGVVLVERSILVPDCSEACSVWIPSSFTPDGDDINDVWHWSGECIPEEYAVSVFDRFGEKIYSSTDPLNTWDGTISGVDSPTGVYIYHVGYRLPYQKHKEVTGSVTLVR